MSVRQTQTKNRARVTLLAGLVVATLTALGCPGESAGDNNNTDAALPCGNGQLDPDEECDGEEFGGADCLSATGRSQGELACTARCFLDVSGCHGCGDGVLEAGEECDGSALAGADCESLTGLEQGRLACLPDCTYDVSDCSQCGNGLVEGSEPCDGSNLGSSTCEDLGYVEPAGVACTEDCTLAVGDCYSLCGNNVTEPGELCDGSDIGTATCQLEGFADPGLPGCMPSCQDLDYDSCQAVCGNSVVEPGEVCDDGNNQTDDGCPDGPTGTCELAFCGDGHIWTAAGEECDGADLGGATCQSLTGQPGPMRCRDDCTLDEDTCLLCGDGMVDPYEGCDGANVRDLDCRALGYTAGSLTCQPGCTLDAGQCSGPRFYFYESFELNPVGRWTLTGDWVWGTEATPSSVPLFEGRYLAAMPVASYPYPPSPITIPQTATSPAIDLTGAIAPVLNLHSAWAPMLWRLGNLKISTDGSDFAVLDPVAPPYIFNMGNESFWQGDEMNWPETWTSVQADLSAYVGETVWLRLDYRSEYAFNQADWLVDSIIVAEAGGLPVRLETNSSLSSAAVDLPWSAELQASGGSGSYNWSVQSGVNHAWLNLDPASGVLSGTPDATDVGLVELTVRVADATDANNYVEKTLSMQVVTPVDLPYFESFDGPGPPTGWILTGDWEWGPVVYDPMYPGPMGCVWGACLGTNLSGSYSLDLDEGDCTATSPPIDLTDATGMPYLEYQAYVMTELGHGAQLQVSTDGVDFEPLQTAVPPFSEWSSWGPIWSGFDPMDPYQNFPNAGQWATYDADLSAYLGEVIYLRFAFYSANGLWAEMPGWYIDELTIWP
ncbi:MAG: putative Ig domain-containing protein [bacterium]